MRGGAKEDVFERVLGLPEVSNLGSTRGRGIEDPGHRGPLGTGDAPCVGSGLGVAAAPPTRSFERTDAIGELAVFDEPRPESLAAVMV